MHIIRTYLYLKRLPVKINYSRMERLIHITFRYGDIVLESFRNRLPYRMDRTQYSITIANIINEYTNRRQIVYLIERLVLLHHLAINAEEMFRSAVYLALDARTFELIAKHPNRLIYKSFAFFSFLLNIAYQLIIFLGFHISKTQVFQFTLDIGYPQSIGKRCKNIERFFCYTHLFFGLDIFERTHIVKPVRQFYQDNANILRHRQEHLTEALYLLFFLRLELKSAEFRHAIDKTGDLGTELFGNIVERDTCILCYIVQKSRADRDRINTKCRQYLRNTKRMCNIFIPALSELVAMCNISELICSAHQIDRRIRLIRLQGTDNFINCRYFYSIHIDYP